MICIKAPLDLLCKTNEQFKFDVTFDWVGRDGRGNGDVTVSCQGHNTQEGADPAENLTVAAVFPNQSLG